MLQERSTLPLGPAASGGVALRCIWDVDADSTYDVPVARARRVSSSLREDGGTGLVAIRTIRGKGALQLAQGDSLSLTASSLVLVEWDQIRRYYCAAPEWCFWWFEFVSYGPLHLPRCEIICLGREHDEEATFAQIQTGLLSGRHLHRCAASARFLLQLYEWGQHWDERAPGPYDDRIQQVIRRMYDRLSERWTVTDMAREAGMSDAWFRREFRRITGSPPKRFHDQLRITWAEELLRTTPNTVAQVADSLGYSSPFHFSKAFKRFTGISPSDARGTAPSPPSPLPLE